MFQDPRMARRLTNSGPWYEFRAAAGDNDVDEVLVYDAIAWYAIDAKDFVRDLAKLKAPNLRVRINSPGGSVFDGVAIYNALRRHHARVEVRIEGLAASIASIIALAGDSVAMEPSAFLMIHDPWAVGIGSATELRELAGTLDKIAGTLTQIYVKKTGMDEAEVREAMAAETWYTAEEALEAGLVDEVLSDDGDAEARVRFDLSGFRNPPEPAAPAAKDVGELKVKVTVSNLDDLEKLKADADEVEAPNRELMRRRLALGATIAERELTN